MACDAQALKQLNEDEEAEFEREEFAQQAELRAILCNALNADDLLDDDDDDDDEDEENLPHSNSSMFSQDNSIADDGSELAWQLSVAPQPAVPTVQHQTSTPRNLDNSLPVLQTPSTVLHSLYAAKTVLGQPNNYQQNYGTDELSLSQDGFNDFEGSEFIEQNAQRWLVPGGLEDIKQTLRQDDLQHYYEVDCGGHEQSTYHNGNELGLVHQFDVEGQFEAQQFGMEPNLEYSELPYSHQTVQHALPATSEMSAKSYLGAHINSAFTTAPGFKTNPVFNDMLATWPRLNENSSIRAQSIGRPRDTELVSQSPTKATNRESEFMSGDSYQYRVSYKPPTTLSYENRVNDKRTEVVAFQSAHSNESPSDKLQQEFLQSDAQSVWSDRETQLRVLLDAKTHRIEELSSSLKELQDSSEREMRISNHQLIMMKDERDGLSQTIRQSELLIQEKQSSENQLHGQVSALKAEVSTLLQTKEDMVKKLATMESVVDSLNCQLSELGSSDAMARARQQHEAIVAGLRQKMDTEAMSFNSKIDAMNQQLIHREDMLIDLRKQVSDLEKTKKLMLQEHGEEINRLHRTLKESQQECRDLLEAQGSQEFSRMKVKLQSTLASKALTDDLNNTLQTELLELREQLQMYEMVTKYSGTVTTGIQTSRPRDTTLDDSYTQLGIKKPGREGPQSTVSDRSLDSGVLSADDAVHGLKTELERCLRKCREKSQLVTKLQAELSACQSSVEENNAKLESTQRELTETKALVKRLESSGIDKLQRQYDSVLRENDSMTLELEELRRRLAEVADSESRVTELNIELSQQINQLIHDRTANNNNDEQLCVREEQLQECLQLQQRVLQLSEQIGQLQQELLTTKEMYVDVCKSKDSFESEVQYLKKDLAHQQQLAEQLSLEHINTEIASKVRQLTEEHDKKVATVEKYYLEKQSSLEQETKSLIETIQTLERQISDMGSEQEVIRSDLEKEHTSKLSELESHYLMQLDEKEQQFKLNMLEVQKQHNTSLADLQELYKRTLAELDCVKTDFDSVQQSLRSENANLQAELENLQKKHSELQSSLKLESELQFKNLLAEKTRLEGCVNELVKCSEKSEIEKKETLNNNKQLVEELEQQVSVLTRKLSEADDKANVLVAQMQESLERKHSIVVATLQEKLSSKNKYTANEDEDGARIDKMKLMAEELRSQYVAAMEQMKAAVLSHSCETARCCAEQFQLKLVKDRQTTAKSLRGYYLRCLAKLLDADFDHVYKSKFLKRMERLLDNLPERDVNAASQCPTPSIIMSSANSPRDLTSAETTPRNVPSRTVSSKHPDVPSLLLSDSSSNSESGDSTPRDFNEVSNAATLPISNGRFTSDDAVQGLATSSIRSCISVSDLHITARPSPQSGNKETPRGEKIVREHNSVVARSGSAPMWTHSSSKSTVSTSSLDDSNTWVTRRT